MIADCGRKMKGKYKNEARARVLRLRPSFFRWIPFWSGLSHDLRAADQGHRVALWITALPLTLVVRSLPTLPFGARPFTLHMFSISCSPPFLVAHSESGCMDNKLA